MNDLVASDATFNSQESALLVCLAQTMIPAVGDMPAASDGAIFPGILTLLSDHTDTVRDGLAVLVQLVVAENDTPFVELGETERLALVDRLAEKAAVFVGVFQDAVVTCYYRDDRVLAGLGMPARAPYPGGNPVADTDWQLLAPVRQRQPFYRIAETADE